MWVSRDGHIAHMQTVAIAAREREDHLLFPPVSWYKNDIVVVVLPHVKGCICGAPSVLCSPSSLEAKQFSHVMATTHNSVSFVLAPKPSYKVGYQKDGRKEKGCLYRLIQPTYMAFLFFFCFWIYFSCWERLFGRGICIIVNFATMRWLLAFSGESKTLEGIFCTELLYSKQWINTAKIKWINCMHSVWFIQLKNYAALVS